MSYLIEIDQFDQQINKLKKKRSQKIHEVQQKCKHPAECVVEGVDDTRSEPSHFRNPPPFRVCTNCSYREDGYAYDRLNYDYKLVRQVSRDIAIKFLRHP